MGDNSNENLNTLQDMILDEERLVTYVSLSKELCIHVNESKMLLRQAVDNIRQKKTKIDLNVNYIISGITDKNIARTVVCTESDRNILKKDFKYLSFEHIYSVSKGYSRVDSCALLAINKLEDLILCTGSIKNINCEKRTADEIGTLKSNSQDLALLHDEKTSSIPLKKATKISVEKSINEPEKKKVETKCCESMSIKNINPEDNSLKKDVISKPKVNNVNIRQKGITGFFKSNGVTGKKESTTKTIKKETSNFEEPTKLEVKVKEISVDIKAIDECYPINENDNQVKKEKENVANKDDIKENKSQSIIKKNLKIDKKRKRVLLLPDSDSENEANDNDPFVTEDQNNFDNESEDEIPPTPSVNTIKITSGILNPKKKRKLVDKTYTSEDGYILTKKVEVYESCSDNEEVMIENVLIENKIKVEISPKEKSSEIKHSKKKVSTSGKQSTLMNYFKKVIN